MGAEMAKKIQTLTKFCMILVFIFIFSACASSQTGTIANSGLIGTWISGTNENMAVFQFRSNGSGCEIVIDQNMGFNLLYYNFSYSLTGNVINITYLFKEGDNLVTGHKSLSYEMSLPESLTLQGYIEGEGLAFVKQQYTRLEGLWRRSANNVVDYIFAGSILMKLQDGVPFAFGSFQVSESVLTLTEQARYISIPTFPGPVWVPSNIVREEYNYRLSGKRLSWAYDGVEYLFIGQ
jgi:hypothetical protein